MEGLKKLSSLMKRSHDDGIQMQLNPFPASEITDPSQPTISQVRILTYNIFLRPPPIKTNKNDHKNSRVDEFIKFLGDYDVICLQEAFGFWNKRKQKLVKLTQKQGFVFYVECPNPSIFSTSFIDGGLVIFSRFPIVRSEFYEYPYSILADSAAMKGVLYAKISVGDNHLHVFTTHTQATHGGKYDPDTYITRGDQLLSFRRFIDKILAKEFTEGDVAILCGDFNVNARNPWFSITNIEQDYTPLKLYPSLKEKERINEYQSMLTMLSKNFEDEIVDLLYETLKDFPPTYGVSRIGPNGKEEPDETILTHAEDHCTNLCLDYIFQLIPKYSSKLELTMPEAQFCKRPNMLRVKPKSSRVEPFYVKHPKVTQLSDHLGLVTTIEVVPFPENGKKFGVPDDKLYNIC